jgi:hypothetical protein
MEWGISIAENNCKLVLLYPEKLPFIIEEEIKTFHDKQKLNQFMTTKPTLQKILKGILQTEKQDKCNQRIWGEKSYEMSI